MRRIWSTQKSVCLLLAYGYKSTYWFISMEIPWVKQRIAVCSLCPSPTMGFFLTFFRFAISPLTLSNNVAQDTVTLQAVSRLIMLFIFYCLFHAAITRWTLMNSVHSAIFCHDYWWMRDRIAQTGDSESWRQWENGKCAIPDRVVEQLLAMRQQRKKTSSCHHRENK